VDSYSDISLCTFHILNICQWSEIATPHVHITAFENKYSDCQVNHLVQAVALIQSDECKSKLLIFTYETACAETNVAFYTCWNFQKFLCASFECVVKLSTEKDQVVFDFTTQVAAYLE